METKICNKCKIEKDINKFWKAKRYKNGLFSWCKECSGRYRKKWHQKNPEYNKEWKLKNPIKHWCQKTIGRHKRSGYKVLFTWRELLPIAKKTTHCPFCNTKVEYSKKRSFKNASLDRTDNENFLTLDNIQIICHKCNSTKLNRTMKEFIDYCKEIVIKYL